MAVPTVEAVAAAVAVEFVVARSALDMVVADAQLHPVVPALDVDHVGLVGRRGLHPVVAVRPLERLQP